MKASNYPEFNPFRLLVELLWLLIIAGMLLGCGRKKEMETNHYSERITTEREKINLPGVKLQVEWPMADTILVGDTIVKEDERTGAQLRFYRNEYNRLVSECETKDTVFVTEYVEREVESQQQKATVHEPGFFEKMGIALRYGWWMIVVGIIVYMVLRRWVPILP